MKEAFTHMYIYKERVHVRMCVRHSAFGALGASAFGASEAAAGASFAGAARNSPVVNWR